MLEQVQKVFKLTQQELKEQVILKKKQDVFYLLLNRKANSFTHDFIRAINKRLDQIQQSQGPTALVTISLSKLFSGGLDLKYASNLPYESQQFFVLEFIHLIGRLSLLPIPTFAIVKGGAVAGGCMFSFSHDFIFVADKALFMCNEVDIGLPLPPGMFAVIKKKHTNYQSLRDMCLMGKKFTAQQALKQRMIDGIQPSSTIISEVDKLAQNASSYGDNKINFKKLKQQMYKDVIQGCFCKQQGVGSVGEVKMPLLPKL